MSHDISACLEAERKIKALLAVLEAARKVSWCDGHSPCTRYGAKTCDMCDLQSALKAYDQLSKPVEGAGD